MGRIVSCSCAAILAIICEKAPAAHAEISLISAWQHCEPTKGCMKFAFMPNGHVIEQYPLAGSIVTAHGDFHIRGDVLEIGWHRFEPTGFAPRMITRVRTAGVYQQVGATSKDPSTSKA